MAREWPPATVWLAAAAVAVPPVGYFGWLVVGHGLDPQALAGGLLGLPPAAGLLGGRRGVWRLTVLGTIWVGCRTAAAAVDIGRQANPAGLAVVAVLAGWVATTAALLWWPDTRRWCGLLPAGPGAGDES